MPKSVQKIFIDGQQVEWKSFEIHHSIDHTQDVFLRNKTEFKRPQITVDLVLHSGLRLSFTPEAHETLQNEVHMYGVLDQLFPAVAKSIRLDDWQVAYLDYMAWKEHMTSQSILRFKVNRNDQRFDSDEALSFKAGFEAAQKKV